MIWSRLTTIRGQLVLLYVGVLAVLLMGLGIFQSVTLSTYLRTTTAKSLGDSARAEIALLARSYYSSDVSLLNNAQTLSALLGSHDTAVKIVTCSGETLADHGFGSPGQSIPLHLSAATIRQLIGAPSSPGQPSTCAPQQDRTSLTQGDLVLVAVPLGPLERPVGFAILGRSFADAGATIRRTEVVFALGGLVALAVAAILALPLINRALRPLRRIARIAGSIATGDLQQRANLTSSPDEIGRLGDAFDTMVDRLEAALTSANDSEERMRRFLADASHELRTPMTALRGTTQVLLRQGGSGIQDVDRALQAVHDETVRLSRLVDDLLTLSRLDAGQSLDPQLVTLRSYFEDFLERYAHVWSERTIRLDVEALNGSAVLMDPEALRRILTNLIDNAARYSTSGKSITLSGIGSTRDVTIEIHDEGPGLSPADAKQVFERFFRGRKNASRHRGGTGLGLAIVDALVKESGGNIRFETAPERGTTVSFTLPRALSPLDKVQAERTSS